MSSTRHPLFFVVLKSASIVFTVFLLVLPFSGQNPTPAVVVVTPPDEEVKQPEPLKPHVYVETYVPVHEVELPDFAAIKDVKNKKKHFFEFLTPYIEAENNRLLHQHNWLIDIQNQIVARSALSEADQFTLQKLYKTYRVKHLSMSTEAAVQELLRCVDALPKSLVLMQAANESAWGTSRFARLGLNFFGKWCYAKGCGVVPNGRPEGETYEVEAYLSVADSVRSYYRNINANPAYKLLREIRAQLRENNLPLKAEILATGLIQYSSRGDHYVQEISQMISYNERFLAD